MTTTTFVDNSTVIVASWLNDVDQVVYDADGANFVDMTPAGTGAVPRSVQTKLREIVSPEDFGAAGNGSTDDATALTTAIAALSAGGTIRLSPGKIYIIGSSVAVNKQLTFELNGSTLKFPASYNVSGGTLEMFAVSADDVVFQNGTFDAQVAPSPSTNSRFVWSTAARTTVRNCRAIGLPSGTSNVQVAFGSSIAASEFTVTGCYFNNCPGAAFSQGPRPFFAYNRVVAPKDVSFALNSQTCTGGQVIGNSITNAAGTIVSGHILAEEGASDWTIANNYVYGVKNGQAIGAISISVLTIVDGGLIQGNIIDGGGFTTTTASSLISVSNYYKKVKIEGNKLKGMPAGLSNNTAVVLPLLASTLKNNQIECLTGTTSGNAVVLNPAGDVCDIVDNYINCTTGPSRIFVFGAGSNSGSRVFFKGGSFIGSTEAINTAINAPTNIPLWLENLTEVTSTAVLNLSGTDSIIAFFNTYNAVRWPHSIKTQRHISGNAAPTAGAWLQGDTVNNVAPAAGGTPGWVCVTSGTPGTWKARANVAA